MDGHVWRGARVGRGREQWPSPSPALPCPDPGSEPFASPGVTPCCRPVSPPQSGIENTPLTPYLDKELLYNNGLAVDGSKVEATGFSYAHPAPRAEVRVDAAVCLFYRPPAAHAAAHPLRFPAHPPTRPLPSLHPPWPFLLQLLDQDLKAMVEEYEELGVFPKGFLA